MMADLLLNLSSLYLSSWIVELKANPHWEGKARSTLPSGSQKLKVAFAEVVKLANTLRSGRSGRKSLRVQLPPSAVSEVSRLWLENGKFRKEKLTW